MLRPDYFYGKTDKLVEMYQDLENWIISDIATRLIKSGGVVRNCRPRIVETTTDGTA